MALTFPSIVVCSPSLFLSLSLSLCGCVHRRFKKPHHCRARFAPLLPRWVNGWPVLRWCPPPSLPSPRALSARSRRLSRHLLALSHTPSTRCPKRKNPSCASANPSSLSPDQNSRFVSSRSDAVMEDVSSGGPSPPVVPVSMGESTSESGSSAANRRAISFSLPRVRTPSSTTYTGGFITCIVSRTAT